MQTFKKLSEYKAPKFQWLQKLQVRKFKYKKIEKRERAIEVLSDIYIRRQ